MVEHNHPKLSIRSQCELLSISRSSSYYKPCGESAENLKIMRVMDEEYLLHPFYGSRKMVYFLERQGMKAGRHRVRRLMRIMGIQAIYQKPRTTIKNKDHKIYPYLLKNVAIDRPNQVWATDITYIPMRKGFMYLVAIIDWASRKVLSWRLSNTMDVRFCVDALKEALAKYGVPEIFNTDQGSQFTSLEFTQILQEKGIKISMDSVGRWMDNVMIERLWRSVKYECVYLREFDSVSELKTAITEYMQFYNLERPHATFDGQMPEEVYTKSVSMLTQLAA